jgi:metal-dependent amidase/aminoacylase/carboxypeptidase family protein
LKETITKLTEGLCEAYGAKSTIQFSAGIIYYYLGSYRPVINEEQLVTSTRKKLEAIIKDLVIEDSEKSFAGEDFC